MRAVPGSFPGLGARSPLGGTAFGSRTHAAGHDAVHDTFMTLLAYTMTSEDEVHELGPGVRSCFHSARSDPRSATRERMERECPATSAEVQQVRASCGCAANIPLSLTHPILLV